MSDIILLKLDRLFPDLDQPRRLIPVKVAKALAAGRRTAADVLKTHLNPDKATTPYARRALAELELLADSIAKERQAHPDTQGLVNPVTVSRAGKGRYKIETGEQRYWAFVLLRERGGAPDTIPAQVIEIPSATRQVAENLRRRGLNAMETA